MSDLKAFLDGLNFGQWILLTLSVGATVLLASYYTRLFIGTLRLHEDMEKILAELKKLTEEKK